MPSSSDRHFEAEDVSLSRVFQRSQNTYFKVPRFQRQYTWSNDNIEDFWSDIKSDDIMFFGSLLLNMKEIDKGFIEIVDGQQRITTVTIFASLIRNLMFEYSKKDIISSDQRKKLKKHAENKIEKVFIWDDDIDPVTMNTVEKLFIVHNKEAFRKFFRENIQMLNPGDYHKVLSHKFPSGSSMYNVVQNYKSLKDCIESDVDFINALENDDLLRYFVGIVNRFNSMMCVEIEIRDEALAYEYFDAVNARGVELSVSDLLKNLFLQNLPEDFMRNAQDEWDRMEESILELKDSGASIDRFFNYYWCAKREYISGGGKKLYKAIKKTTTTFSKEDWKLELLEISSYCDLYCDLLSGGKEKFSKITDRHQRKRFYLSLKALRSMKNDTWIVFLMNYLFNIRTYQQKNLYADQVGNLLEYFVFNYFTVLGLGGNAFFTLMHSNCQKFNSLIEIDAAPSKFLKAFEQFKGRVRDYKPTDKDHYVERATERIRYEAKNNLIRYVFSKIEKDVLGGQPGGWDMDEVDIEHILPQSPKSHWKIPKNKIKPPRTLHMLGNLSLLERTINIRCGNKDFKSKKIYYKDSRFKLINEPDSLYDLVHSKRWDNFEKNGVENLDTILNLIQARSKYIVTEFIYKHWVEDYYSTL